MIKVYGASDDLLEVEGKNLNDEFGCYGTDEKDPAYLSFSDGTLLSCVYDHDGIWRLNIVQKGSSFVSKDECIEETRDNHSDIVWLGEDVKWVVFGNKLVKAKKPKDESAG